MESSSLIQHIDHTVEGWFDFKNFYRYIADWIPDGGTWVEVGVYAGKSFGFGIIEYLNRGKKIDFVAVDIFPDEWIYDKRPDGLTVRDKFDIGMKPLVGHFRVLPVASVEAAKQFKDGSIDFVFIDAAHDYDSVIADITAWLPKVKKGGIIAGYDYEDYWRFSVMRAVDDMFGDRVETFEYDDLDKKHCWKVQL